MNTSRADIAFLFDVDNTLLDNGHIIAELECHLQREVGVERAQHYWRLFEQLRTGAFLKNDTAYYLYLCCLHVF